jgi:capsular polysaccharide biosynthesis protein
VDHRAETTADPRRTVVFSTIAKALPVIIGITVIFGAAGILLSRYQAQEYTATSRVVLSATRSFTPLDGGSSGSPTRYVANQLEVMKGQQVLQRAADVLNTGTLDQPGVQIAPAPAGQQATPGQLAGALELTAPADTDVIVITATGPTGQLAADRANAVTLAYARYVTDQVTAAAQAASTAAAADPVLVTQIGLRAIDYGDGVQDIDAAVAPREPSAPQPLRNGFLLAVIGALLSTSLVVLRRGQPLADRGELVESAGAPVLGVVPVPLPRISKRKAPPLPAAQDFSMVLVALGYVVADTSGVIMCSGIRRESGTATVALGLAAAAAEQQRRVVVVDADTRGSDLVRHGGQPAPGLPVGALSDPATPQERVAVELTDLRPVHGGGSVHLATVASDGPMTWGADALRKGLQRLVDSFDVVVLHTGPVATDPMAFAMLRESSVLVAVVDERARTADLLALQEKLQLAGAQCDGLVLTRPVATRRGGRRQPASSSPPLPDVFEHPPGTADDARSDDRVAAREPVPSGAVQR